METQEIIARLSRSDEPSVRYRLLVDVLGKKPESPEARKVRREIPASHRVKGLLSERGPDGTIPGSPYAKWTGAHWVLAMLADIGHPPGDASLLPLRDQVYDLWLSERHAKEWTCRAGRSPYGRPGVPVIEGRARRCASQEGNALYATLALGIADDRADRLADNLIRWQWPDGGWNCDKNPPASHSSFMESLIPLRGLALHAKVTGSSSSKAAAERAADIFLKRRLYKRQRDGSVMNGDFVRLHYPCYWHYDVLFGLKVMAETGFISDPRCRDALDLLESRRLPDGGFPAEGKYYRVVDQPANGGSRVDWGGAGRRRTNEFVTVDALYVLRLAGRLR
jgi:hypothetical protein